MSVLLLNKLRFSFLAIRMHHLLGDDILKKVNLQGDLSGQSKYVVLSDFLASEIKSGFLKAGEALPPENRIAERFQIARSTVRQAMASLEQDGLISRIHGKGTFVHKNAKEQLVTEQALFALIVPETEAAFYPSFQRSFEKAAAELHHQVIVCNSRNQIELQGNSILQLIDLKVAGVAIVPPTNVETPVYHIRQLQQHGIPVVCCSRTVAGTKVPLLAIPFEEVGRRAGEEIRKAGHRHVAYFGSNRDQAATAYETGFRKAIGKRVSLSVFYGAVPTENKAGYEAEMAAALDQLLLQKTRPTAMFCSFDTLAELLFILLTQRGLKVPRDVSIIGFGGTCRGDGLSGRLSSVVIDELALGASAINLLDQMRQRKIPLEINETQNISVGFSPGQTLGKMK